MGWTNRKKGNNCECKNIEWVGDSYIISGTEFRKFKCKDCGRVSERLYNSFFGKIFKRKVK